MGKIAMGRADNEKAENPRAFLSRRDTHPGVASENRVDSGGWVGLKRVEGDSG